MDNPESVLNSVVQSGGQNWMSFVLSLIVLGIVVFVLYRKLVAENQTTRDLQLVQKQLIDKDTELRKEQRDAQIQHLQNQIDETIRLVSNMKSESLSIVANSREVVRRLDKIDVILTVMASRTRMSDISMLTNPNQPELFTDVK